MASSRRRSSRYIPIAWRFLNTWLGAPSAEAQERAAGRGSPCSTVGSGRLSCVSPTGFRLRALPPSTRRTRIWCPPDDRGCLPRVDPPEDIAAAAFRRLAAAAGIRRGFAPHQLRHAHAVELARERVPLNVFQCQLGHVNLGTTSIYLQGIDSSAATRRASAVGLRASRRMKVCPTPGGRRWSNLRRPNSLPLSVRTRWSCQPTC